MWPLSGLSARSASRQAERAISRFASLSAQSHYIYIIVVCRGWAATNDGRSIHREIDALDAIDLRVDLVGSGTAQGGETGEGVER